MKNRLGFTLIELLVTIVIIGVLSTISIVSFKGYAEKARMAKAKANFSQIKTLFLAQNASTENELFTGWYSFDTAGDINVSNPYILDRSFAENDLTLIAGTGAYSQSDETGLGTGKSLKTEGRQFFKTGGFGNRPVNKITMSFWFKINEFPATHTYPVYAGTAGVILYTDGKIRFYIDDAADNLITAVGTVQADKWYYIVASYHDETMRIWLDGELIATKENVVQDMSFSEGYKGVNLGYHPDSSFFNGWLDEVMFFPYAFGGERLE